MSAAGFAAGAALHSPPSGMGGGRSDWRLRRSVRGAPAARSARAVTRVESISRVAKIDWLNCTFPESDEFCISDLAELIQEWTGCRVAWWSDDAGIFGFEHRQRIAVMLPSGASVELGFYAWGGESQRGRCLLQFTGKGCGLVKDWSGLMAWLVEHGASITRVDLAVDFLSGEHSVDDAVDLYMGGAFVNRGRNPELSSTGDWLEGGKRGRTVYIGKLKNGKTLCVYEKGKQLKDYESNWTRYEVRLGNRDRVIPLDVLVDPDKYFVGAYPALEAMLEVAAEKVPTVKREAQASLASLAVHMERCYGKAIHQILETTGATPAELIQEVRVVGIPKKVDPAGGVLGVAWADFQAQKRRLEA